MERVEGLKLGLTASVVAFVIIEYLLIVVSQSGVYKPFEGVNLLLISSLIPIGLAAYIGYLSWMRYGRRVFQIASALALVLGSGAIYMGVLGSEYSLALLVTAYFTEVVVGPFLMKGFEEIDHLSSRLFVVGIAGFVFTLPLVALNPQYALIPFAFNLLKGFGLSKLLIMAVKGEASGVAMPQAYQISTQVSRQL